VPLLMSTMIYELLSEGVQRLCRQLDTVTVKGSEVPVGIFTYDSLQDQPFPRRTREDVLLYAGMSAAQRASLTQQEQEMQEQVQGEQQQQQQRRDADASSRSSSSTSL
jgi:hypothetical protein